MTIIDFVTQNAVWVVPVGGFLFIFLSIELTLGFNALMKRIFMQGDNQEVAMEDVIKQLLEVKSVKPNVSRDIPQEVLQVSKIVPTQPTAIDPMLPAGYVQLPIQPSMKKIGRPKKISSRN